MKRRWMMAFAVIALTAIPLWIAAHGGTDLFAPIRKRIVSDRSALVDYTSTFVSGSTPKMFTRIIRVHGASGPEVTQVMAPVLAKAGYQARHLGAVPEDEEFYSSKPHVEMVEIMDDSQVGSRNAIIQVWREPTWSDEVIGRVMNFGGNPYIDSDDNKAMGELFGSR